MDDIRPKTHHDDHGHHHVHAHHAFWFSTHKLEAPTEHMRSAR